MMVICPVCGKNTAVHWPENWVYRRGEKYLCSENCMIVFDTREFREKTGWIDDYYRRKKEMRKKISLDQKKKAVEIALGGGNPLKYLEECGSANPSAAWFYIKKVLKEKDPETWEKLKAEPEEVKEPEEIPEEIPEEVQADTVSYDPEKQAYRKEEMTVTIEGKEIGTVPADVIRSAMENVDEIRKRMEDNSPASPLNYDGFDVLTIKNEWGMFHYDAKFGLLDWTSPDGEEVSLTPDGWKTFATEILPKAMAILGATAKN